MFPSARLRQLPVLAIAVLTLSGCALRSVESYAQRGADLQAYHTYSWGPGDALSTGDPRLDNNELFDKRVRTGVEKELARKGLEKATSGMPDLLVHYHASVTQKIDTSALDRGYRYCADADCRAYVYDAGTLFIDLIDARANELVWRGWAEGSVDGAIDNQELMETQIDEAVARILQKLPRM